MDDVLTFQQSPSAGAGTSSARAAIQFPRRAMTLKHLSLGLASLSLMLGVSSLRAQDSNLPFALPPPADTPAAATAPAPPKKTVSFDLTSVDKSADPCTD